ncbi:hypothetical protein [Novosphingobium sp. BL-52-GroH]|uniref:hypothetical protein n=1 Tax=Novosphingobium sp. BL-52-GroH TaxID=3349877 RepID=UPI00384D90DF
MWVLMELIFLLLAGFVMLALCIAIAWALMVVLRIVAMLGLAAILALAVGLGFAAAGADAGPATLMGVVAFPLAVWMLRRRSAGRSRPFAPAVQDNGLRVSYAGPVESEADAPLGAAWERLAAMVPLENTAPLFEARAACVQLLRVAEHTAIDLEIVACAVFLRRNLPEPAGRNARLWARADAAGRAVLSRGIVEDTVRLGVYAMREMAREAEHDRRADGDDLTALRNHIAARTG